MIQKSLTKNFDFVWSKDPALDQDAPGFKEAWDSYQESLEPGGLPVKDGQKPARFICAPLSMGAYQKMLGEISEFSRCVEAIRYGLRMVDGFHLDGVPVQIGVDDKRRDGRDERLKDEFLEKIWDPNLFVELGLAIVKQSQLDPTRGRG